MIRMLGQSARSLARTPGVTAVVLLTMAVAIGANAAIFSVLNAVVLRPLGYPESDRLVTLWETNPGQGLEQVQVSLATFLDWRERTASLQEIAVFRHRGGTLMQDGEPQHVATLEVSPALFSLLGVPPALGGVFGPADETPGHERRLVLTHGAWQRRFGGDRDIVGRAVLLDDEPYEVVGVMPDGFVFPPGDREVEAFSPVTVSLQALPSRPHRMYEAIARLAAGVTLEQARRELRAVAAQLAREFPDAMQGWSAAIVPAREQLVGPVRDTFLVLFAAVLLVLAIGCVNVANLLLARAPRVIKEFAIRAAMGAPATSLLGRALVESTLLALCGGAAGLLLALWADAGLRAVVPATVPRAEQIGVDATVVAFTGLVALLAGVAFGLAPGLRLMRPRLTTVLQSSGRGGSLSRRARWFADALVVTEVAMAIVLLAGAGLTLRSLQRLHSVDPGFRTHGVTAVALSLPRSRYPTTEQTVRLYDELVREVAALPGVDAAGAVSALPMSPLGTDFDIPFTVEGLQAASPTERPRADYRAVVAGYFEALGVRLVQGRLLRRGDGDEGRLVAVVNEELARRYLGGDALGRRIQLPMAGELEIVGVVGNVRHGSLRAATRPEVFVPLSQLALRDMHLVVRSSGTPGRVAAGVRAVVHRLDSRLPLLRVASMEELVADSLAQPRFNAALLAALAGCAALLAAIGIYGVVSYAVAQRTGEIGVRRALGAGDGATVRLVIGDALRVVGVGVASGLLGAAYLGRFLGALLYEIAPVDLPTYAVTALAVLLVGALAAWLPARRAARVDPVIALRQE